MGAVWGTVDAGVALGFWPIVAAAAAGYLIYSLADPTTVYSN